MNFTFKKKWEILVFVLLGVAFVGFFLFFYFNGTASAPTAGRRDALILFFTFMVVTIWGVLILYRLQDRTVWFFYLGILLLTQIWLVSGVIKRMSEPNSDLDYAMWLFAYIPMIFIPTFWLGICAKQFTHWKLKRFVWTHAAVASALALLILTNPLHHLAFTFDSSGTVDHHVFYYVVYAYIGGAILTCLTLFVRGTLNKRNTISTLLWPFIAITALLLYSLLYLIPVTHSYLNTIPPFNNYYMVYSLLSTGLAEIAIQTGLMQNTGRYVDYFKYGPYRLALADRDYNLVYQNVHFQMIPDLQKSSHATANGFRYQKRDTSNGYLLIQEDIRDILRLRQELFANEKALKSANEVLKTDQRVQGELIKNETRQQLNEFVYAEISLESERIQKLVDTLPDELTPDNRSLYTPTLIELKIRLTFLKQRCLLLINGSDEGTVSYADFALSMGSLKLDLQNLNYIVAVSYREESTLGLPLALQINNFLHQVIDGAGLSAGMILLNIDPKANLFKCRVSGFDHFDPSKVNGFSKTSEEDGDYLYTVKVPKEGEGV